MIKHIVVAGCSFTYEDYSWAHILDENNPDIKVHNLGIPGTGNYVISTHAISHINTLLESGVDSSEILSIIQWSGIERKSFIGNTENSILDVPFDTFCREQTKLKSLSETVKKSKLYRDSGKKNNHRYWNHYKDNYWSDECAFIETVEHILRVQWFLKTNNIDFLMFNGWDQATLATGNSPHPSYPAKAGSTLGQFELEEYVNIGNPMLKDIYPWSTHLWDMIDFEKFAFVETENIKFGGLLQWGQQYLEKELWFVSSDDRHPSPEANNGFYNQFIKPFVNKNVNDRVSKNENNS